MGGGSKVGSGWEQARQGGSKIWSLERGWGAEGHFGNSDTEALFKQVS